MGNMSMLQMLMQGGVVILILLVCSIVSITVILERLRAFQGIKPAVLEEIKGKVRGFVMSGKIADAINYCESFNTKWLFFKVQSPLTGVLKTIIFSHKMEKKDLQELAMRTVDKEIVGLEKNLGIVGTIGNISLYIGLFGTVLGIMNAFTSIAQNSATGPAVVSKGIAEALVNTAAGLFVAIVAVIFYNYFVRASKKAVVYFDDTAAEFIDLLKK